ncbi:alpha-amylase family glycosyl hydrolase [Carboxylicivirga sp. N1Y90]|uniref:alpha-amylase family glycosyl hydrolase n=1 Tax=Carboxylicivirga fragile TaxID=3417571 RepID=UPI003D33FD48|nr:hypothetical protein [Marinilabiliaceae bacterium N1Y90]
MKNLLLLSFTLLLALQSCNNQTTTSTEKPNVPFVWENANVYFLLTDRFNNGDKSNDVNFNRVEISAPLRGFMGGDFKGITQKINEGYFSKLGITALWFSPIFEQVHGSVDEGTGLTFAFHGYWTKDWTAIEPNFGTEQEFAALVDAAHANGIRILMDVIINHTGPVTPQDPVWDDAWVRTSPQCKYQDYESTVTCTLVENLPDVKTESDEHVDLPKPLMEKWAEEGRLEQEVNELEAYFASTGYARAPRFYIIKWLTDFIRKYGIDGFRLDTVKHTEETVWADLWKEATKAFNEWKAANPDKVMDDNEFFMVGEVYGYGISGVRMYDFGDRKVDYFSNGMKSLINFEFKSDAHNDYETIFSKYSQLLNDSLKGLSVMNYISSHDDGQPYDQKRMNTLESATKLLLCPGASQVYYGDESARSLMIDGTSGDATLRSFMNWEEILENKQVNGVALQDLLSHWQKLGQFRSEHPAVGAGVHAMIQEKPYYFKRTYSSSNYDDRVVVGLDLDKGMKQVDVEGIFEEGELLTDFYSGKTVKVQNGKVQFDSDKTIVLLAQ